VHVARSTLTDHYFGAMKTGLVLDFFSRYLWPFHGQSITLAENSATI
jgi:hypothetical protein